MMRLFFATDVHGSENCWRKFLNSGKHYEADVVVLGGDMTGKALVPIVHVGGENWHSSLLDVRHELNGKDEVETFEEAVKRRGYYPFRTTREELAELEGDEDRRDRLFHQHMLETLQRWMELADERLAGENIDCFVCPGNDDQFEADEIIAQARHVQLAEGRVVEMGDFQMASTGWANRTPWDTYREEDESELAARIQKMAEDVTTPPEKTIYSFHCPPYGSGLDDAPELTADLRPKYAGRSIVPCGSTAVREAIERDQPILSLHGHIHEAKGTTRLGRTLAINPGSSYEQGQLLGVVVDLDGKKKVKRFVLTTG
jgi:Icc-related predicted phosphoesterase